MGKTVSPSVMAIILKMQQNELTESMIYEKIAAFAKGEENKETLLRLSREEKAHYQIWKSYTGKEMKPQKGKVRFYTLIARLFGFTFAVKLMERGEEQAQDVYQQLITDVKADRDEQKSYIQELKEDRRHLREERDELRERIDKTDESVRALQQAVARNGRQIECMRPLLCGRAGCPDRVAVAISEDGVIRSRQQKKEQEITPYGKETKQ